LKEEVCENCGTTNVSKCKPKNQVLVFKAKGEGQRATNQAEIKKKNCKQNEKAQLSGRNERTSDKENDDCKVVKVHR
jgi:hypothetical protein